MKKFLLAAIISGTSLGNCYAQTLFTYGNNPVTESEFMKVYKKNNAAQKIDYSEQALREYVDLYSLFRMKVKEANDMHIDTSASVSGEIDNYRRQLAKGFLTDNEMIGRLVKEAYDRSKYEVRVAHILLLTNPASDTAALRKQIDSLYAVLSKGKADFAALAKEYSGDAGTKNNGGDIGYISSLQTVYAFENAAYDTQVGKISAPFRTTFGYHIVKVLDKRPARGEVKVAQVLIATPKSAGEAGITAAKLKLDSVQNDLKKGVPFDKVVEKYSDDKFSKDKNGELPVFGVGRMVASFDEAAFGLKKPGDIAKPIQTEYGFHVIKLLEKYPVKPFDSVKKEIKTKVDNDSRAQQARDIYFQNVRVSNGFKENPPAWASFAAQLKNIPDTGAKAGSFNANTFSAGGGNTMFSMAGKNYTQDDFVAYAIATTRGNILANSSKENVFRELYNMYQSKVVNDFQEHKLVDENPEFKSLLQEYKDGIMLFELMDRNVWGKASKDSLGLKAFYETKKNNYLWEPGFRGSVYTFKDEAAMKEGLKMMARKDFKNEDLVKTLNTEQKRDAVTVQIGRYEFSKFNELPQNKIIAGKPSEAVKKDNTYIVVKADEIYTQPVAKSFSEARGYIISAYQDKLEKDWNNELRSKYPVKVNEEEFKKLVH